VERSVEISVPQTTQRSLWGVPSDVAERLEYRGEPVLTAWKLFVLIRRTYHDAAREIPSPFGLRKCAFVLEKENIIRPDPDYPRHYRVLTIPDSPADDIVCLIDQFCHIAYLSAMQRWGLTDRIPHALMISRPDEKTVTTMAATAMAESNAGIPRRHRPSHREMGPFRLNNIAHPPTVRGRSVKLYRSRQSGQSVSERSGFARISTIGQTFLDMLRRPTLCGGMSHVLDIWEEHAALYLDSIITTVETANPIVKCRAGYIIEERLGIEDSRVAAWRDHARRGGSRVLDPARPYAPIWSDKWKISLNAHVAFESH